MSADSNEPTILSNARPAANLIVRQGPQIGILFPITGNRIIIGREETCNVILQDPEVSRRHAELFWERDAYFVKDLGSTNGVFVNGVQITAPARLRTGDNIGIGQTSLVLELERKAAQPQIASQQPAVSSSSPSQAEPPGPKNAFADPKKLLPIGCGCLLLLCFCAMAALIGLDMFNFIDLGLPLP